MQAEWDEEGMLFQPCEEYRKDEEWIVHWLKAENFLDMTTFDPTGLALKFHIDTLKNVVPRAKVLVVLEGLASLLGKAKTAVRRAMDATVRGVTARANKDDKWAGLDVEQVEMALIEMQLVYEMRIVQTSSTADSAEWISILAADIASIPYKYAAHNPPILTVTRLMVDGVKCFSIGRFVWRRDKSSLVQVLKTRSIKYYNKSIE